MAGIEVLRMLDEVATKFGLEDSRTIALCVMVEQGVEIGTLRQAYKELMDSNVMLDE